jgi:hypothetical protein
VESRIGAYSQSERTEKRLVIVDESVYRKKKSSSGGNGIPALLDELGTRLANVLRVVGELSLAGKAPECSAPPQVPALRIPRTDPSVRSAPTS